MTLIRAIGLVAAISPSAGIAGGADGAADAAPLASSAPVESQAADPKREVQAGSSPAGPAFSIDDELILQLKIAGIDATDTIIAFGTREALYLPLGELARILDLAIRISDDGHYASGWVLDESQTVTINLRDATLLTAAVKRDMEAAEAIAFEGEMYVQSDILAEILPLEIKPDLRSQAVNLTTLQPFPFEERMRRDAERARLGAQHGRGEAESFPRQETPWLAASVPLADAVLRAVSDSVRGERVEGELRLAGDLAFVTAQAYTAATTKDGLVASLVNVGRRDADSDLLGPLRATEFQLGDVATSSMPIGLRGRSGRGGFVSNRPFESASVFEKIDLRGILPDGYEVELYRNDVLVGSAAKAANGQYEFLEIPVDYGLNVFRTVFYGPQGQRREEVRRVTVGDGRLAAGAFEYDFGAVQRDVNLLGVTAPDFNPAQGYGNWQAAGRLSYGLTAQVTALASLAMAEGGGEGEGGMTLTAGLRTGAGGLALRADGGMTDSGAIAMGAGIGGKALGGSLTFSHFEYRGGFVDEIRSNSRVPLRRGSEFDFNTSLRLAGKSFPSVARLRHVEFADGRQESEAALRNSGRFGGLVLSNTLEYTRQAGTQAPGYQQLLGSFDLATFRRSRVQMRGSLGYGLLDEIALRSAAAEVDYQLDDRTVASAQATYGFKGGGLTLGAAAIREFDRFSLALDSNYALEQETYSVSLRLGFSFGRDPLRRRFFIDRPGLATSGAASLRAFQDLDGDRIFSDGDLPLPEVDFVAYNDVARTDGQGMARVVRLGNGNRATLQVDPSSLPDIMMAPVDRGIEIMPRPGRFHVVDFPIVALTEIDGEVTFRGTSKSSGVSGLRLILLDEAGEIGGTARTERGGYYLFERVLPGTYTLAVDPEQAARLGICMADSPRIVADAAGGFHTVAAQVAACEPAS